MSEEAVSWLLPDALPDEQAEMRRVITALRLLRDEARTRAHPVTPSWSRARSELELLERRLHRGALDGLLHACLSAALSPDSFLDLGPRGVDYPSALKLLLGAGGRGAALVPGPGESPLALVARLLAAGEASGAAPAWRVFWAACARHAQGPPERAERRWCALLRSALEARARPPLLARLLAGLVSARLECHQPARAWALHARHGPLARIDPGLRRLFGWSALLCGELDHARVLLRAVGEGSEAPPLPRPLSELRSDVPAWAGLLLGSVRGPGLAPELAALRSPGALRRALGAALLGAFVREADGSVRVLALDTTRAFRSRAARRLAEPAEPLELLESGEPRRWRREVDGAPLRGAWIGPSAWAIARVGVRDAEGELAGWLQLESEHWLLPSAARLGALARAWSASILAARRTSARCRDGSRSAWLGEPFAVDDPRQAFVARLFDGLGPLAGMHAAWIEPRGPWHAARGCAVRGTALDLRAGKGGGGAVVLQAIDRRAPARHEGDRAQALHAAATAGVALPLLAEGDPRVLGVLVLESLLGPLEEGRLEVARAALAALAPLYWATSFRAHLRALEGLDLAWDPGCRYLARLEPRIRATAASVAPVLLLGPPGSGRRTLARWLEFRRGGTSDPRALAPSSGGGVRLLELEWLSRQEQRALAHAGVGDGRLLLRGGAPLNRLRERGLLEDELGRALDPVPLIVPPLRERRDEIPGLARVLAANVARREGLELVRFRDDAMADLWRQRWSGNLWQLRGVVERLARTHPGAELGPREVRVALRSLGMTFQSRLPSRPFEALDVELALRSTRHQVGSTNVARAARYLGWDPATLAACIPPGGPGE